MKPLTLHYKELFRLGLPIIIGQIGIIFVSFADTIMVGQYGTDDLGAAGFVNNLFNLAIIFATGFSYGFTPIVGKLYGGGKHHRIGSALKNALFANMSIALLLVAAMGAVYLNIDKMGQPEELLPIMRPYFLVLLLTMPFITLFNAFKQLADGITDTKTPMWIMICGNVMNIIGNYILIYGKFGMPELGLLGAGIATLLSRMAMLAAMLLVFFRSSRYRIYTHGFRQSRINSKELKEINRLGLPVAAQMGMETASFSLATIMVGWLGTTALAAHQIMCTVGQLGFMLYYGMAAAVAIKTSNYNGAGDRENIKRSASAGFHLILIMAVIASATIFILRNVIGTIFTENAEVVVLVSQLALPFILYQFGDGLQCNYSNALRGIADVKPVMLYAFIAYFVISLPVGYLLGFVLDWGLAGVWMSFPFGLTSAGAMFYFRFKSRVTLERA